MMTEISEWYAALSAPLKLVVWVLGILLGFALIKRLVKLAIMVTILIILLVVLRSLVG